VHVYIHLGYTSYPLHVVDSNHNAIRGTRFSEDSVLSDFMTLFFFVFGALNGVSLLASFLLYRQKKFGFWLYLLSNVALIVSTFLLLETLQADYIPISFTFVLIGLFGTQWRRLS
jgi:hypothetical protein